MLSLSVQHEEPRLLQPLAVAAADYIRVVCNLTVEDKKALSFVLSEAGSMEQWPDLSFEELGQIWQTQYPVPSQALLRAIHHQITFYVDQKMFCRALPLIAAMFMWICACWIVMIVLIIDALSMEDSFMSMVMLTGLSWFLPFSLACLLSCPITCHNARYFSLYGQRTSCRWFPGIIQGVIFSTIHMVLVIVSYCIGLEHIKKATTTEHNEYGGVFFIINIVCSCVGFVYIVFYCVRYGYRRWCVHS